MRPTLAIPTKPVCGRSLDLVVDMKAAPIILRRRPNGWLLRRRDGRLACALVDYELLERPAEYEAWLAQAPRSSAPSLSAGSLSPNN